MGPVYVRYVQAAQNGAKWMGLYFEFGHSTVSTLTHCVVLICVILETTGISVVCVCTLYRAGVMPICEFSSCPQLFEFKKKLCSEVFGSSVLQFWGGMSAFSAIRIWRHLLDELWHELADGNSVVISVSLPCFSLPVALPSGPFGVVLRHPMWPSQQTHTHTHMPCCTHTRLGRRRRQERRRRSWLFIFMPASYTKCEQIHKNNYKTYKK